MFKVLLFRIFFRWFVNWKQKIWVLYKNQTDIQMQFNFAFILHPNTKIIYTYIKIIHKCSSV